MKALWLQVARLRGRVQVDELLMHLPVDFCTYGWHIDERLLAVVFDSVDNRALVDSRQGSCGRHVQNGPALEAHESLRIL